MIGGREKVVEPARVEMLLEAAMVAEAPVALVPCGEPALGVEGVPEYWIQDLAAATENIQLTGTGLGLGSVW